MNNEQYPNGQLNPSDEGALNIAIGVDQDVIIVNFGKPVVWFGVPPDHARALAKLLIDRANEIESKTSS